MDYIDRVFVDLRLREPGRYPLDRLKERDLFIEAVKELMDGQWLTELYFTEDYQTLVIQVPLEQIFAIRKKSKARQKRLINPDEEPETPPDIIVEPT
jgi:hypothetical protein